MATTRKLVLTYCLAAATTVQGFNSAFSGPSHLSSSTDGRSKRISLIRTSLHKPQLTFLSLRAPNTCNLLLRLTNEQTRAAVDESIISSGTNVIETQSTNLDRIVPNGVIKTETLENTDGIVSKDLTEKNASKETDPQEGIYQLDLPVGQTDYQTDVNLDNSSLIDRSQDQYVEDEKQDESESNRVKEKQGMMPNAPAMSFRKFLTMQVGDSKKSSENKAKSRKSIEGNGGYKTLDKRVVVTICYSGASGLRPYFLTAAKRIKESFPDVLIEKLILPSKEEGGDDSTFEVLVDGKVVVGKARASRSSGGSASLAGGLRSVFVSLSGLDAAIAKARRKRRPATTVYSDANSTPTEGPSKSKTASMAADRMDAWRRSKQQQQQQVQQS